jgi:hypothetical protein
MATRFRHASEDNCERLGYDPVKVEALARRLKSVADDARKAHILIFAGCFGGLTLRPMYECPAAADILAGHIASNCDGGDGGD